MDLLDNPLESMKKHGLKETQAVQEAVRKKLESFGGLDIDTRIKKLEFEIKWVEDSKKYSTWEVAKKAYEKALVASKFQKVVVRFKRFVRIEIVVEREVAVHAGFLRITFLSK